MTARFSARLAFSFLLMAIAFFAFLLLSASPASAHHRDDHTKGNATTDTGTEESTEGSGTSGADEGATAAATSSDTKIETPSGSVSGDTKSASSTSSGSSSGSGNNDDKAAAGISKHGYDPDPVHQTTPPATTGPTTCPGYNDGDAGAYDHNNCDGTQGLNGNGGNGKCAGCTGKADDKAPGGQYPGDHNNGYECDNNSGVGKGNPAHSRCANPPPPPPPPPPPCVDDMATPQDECNPPQPCVDDMDTPQDECNPPQPCVDNPNTPKDECNPPPKPPKDDDDVLGRITPNVPPDEVLRERPPGGPVLPRTGATTGTFLWLALLLMGAGALILWRTGNRAGANA